MLPCLIDEQIGIVRGVHHARRHAGAPDFFHVYAQACNTRAFCAQRNFARAGGAAADRSDALAKAVGEAVERYCAAIYDARDFPLAYADARSCVDPATFALYSPQQYSGAGFPFLPFTRKTLVRWVPAKDWETGHTCYVPAGMVFLPYTYRTDAGEAPIAQPISTGLACHVSSDEALIGALCEVVERDAVTIAWQARMSPPRIDRHSLDPENAGIVARFERAAYDVTLFDVTTDLGIPVVLAAARGVNRGGVPLAVAAAANADPQRAVRKALEELEHTRALCAEIRRASPPPLDHPDQVVDQIGHLQFWCDRHHRRGAGFLFASRERTSLDRLPDLSGRVPGESLRRLASRVTRAGHRVLVCDVTSPDVRDVGLVVARVIVPGLHPLFMGHRNRALGGQRLWRVPEKLGQRGLRRGGRDNPLPHPYP